MEATKAIPIIQQEQLINTNIEETIVLSGKPKEEKQQDEPEEQKKKKSNRWLKILLTTFLFLVVCGVLAVTVIPGFFIPKEVKVPDVSGMTYEKAVNTLVNKKLVVTSPTQDIYTNEVEEGKVIKTSPAVGQVVRESTKITIFKSGGKQKKKMPNLIGKDYEKSKDELTSYKGVVPDYIESEKPQGEIVLQSPEAGQSIIEEEQEVKVWISKGPKQISLVDFSGWTESSVNSYLNEKKLVPVIKREYSSAVDKGLVISQSPKPDTNLKEGTKVTITVSDGQKEKPTKIVKVDNISIQYQGPATGEKTPQKIEIYKEDMQNTMDKPFETRTITESTTISLEFIIQEGKKGRYKIVRDGTTLIEKEVLYPTQ